MLTKKQSQLLLYINEMLLKNGVCPSYEEMRQHLGLHSKSGIHRMVGALEERRFVRRLPNKARALEVLALPEEKYIKPVKKKTAVFKEIANDNAVEIPLYGKIACGTPIEAVQNPDTINVPAQMMGSGEHYALTVEGDSMKDIGIIDGDTVIIKRTQHVPNGTVAVALVDGYEVTLKRIQVNGNRVLLIPENNEYEIRTLDASRVEVQGQLIGLMRQYH